MSRLVTLTTLQWADLDLETTCKLAKEMGYDGLEIGCVGTHFDVKRAALEPEYVDYVKSLLEKYGLTCKALAAHLIGQCVGDDPEDPRLANFVPAEIKGNPEAIRAWGIENMKYCAMAAKNLGAYVVTGFTGSPIWKYLYSFPQNTDELIENGFQEIRRLWLPILDVFRECGVKFGLEVHPSEIAFDYYTCKRVLELFEDRPEFGLNFDPSHLLWQGINPALFLEDFIDRVYHVHMKDAIVTLDGRTGILGSFIEFGDNKRGWNFRSLGHGSVNFEEIIRILNKYNYQGPLSVEWEDSGMDRVYGATEAAAFVRKVDFPPSDVAFDSAMNN